MVGTQTMLEDFCGAEPDYNDVLICDQCGEAVLEDIYIEKTFGSEIMCRACIEKFAEKNGWEDVFSFAGYDDIIGALEELGVISINELV